MEKSFEKIYRAGEPEKEAEKAAPAVEIPKEEWQNLEIIAKRVGGDFGMEIKLGKPGGGSFFNHEDNSATFDPLHIKEKPEEAKFVAGHEGSHRAITPGPREIGLSREQIQEHYSQIGFGYLQNVIEDPAVNDWMRRRFPGLEPYTANVYDEQLKEENAVLSTPEVQKIAAQLGYWPKFSQYGSEVIRDWHQKKFSKKLDPAVEKALKRTIKLARESIGIIPDPKKPSREKKEIITAGQKRFENNTNYIWPEVKKLVEMDLHTEEQRQMLNEFRQKQKELEQKMKEMEEAQKQGNNQKAGELQKEIDGLKKEQDPFNGLPEDAKKELQEQIDKATREAAEQLNKEIEEKQNQSEGAKQKQEALEKEIQELEEKAKSASGKEKEDLEKQIEKKKEEKLGEEMKQKQAEQDLKQIQDALEDMQSGEAGMPYPEDKLSEETKKEIEKLFQKLPQEKQKDLREKAEKQLEDFEDAINKEMEGKLNEDRPESHKEHREREEPEKRSADKRTKTEEEKKELEKKLEQMRREKMTEYDKAYEETADIINSLYNRLKKFFLPERHPKWQKGFPTGSRLDLGKAMQAEADPKYLEKLWERKTIPHKLDYRFSVLVDLSGSMEGEKIEETFKGVVVLTEVLEKLGIQYKVRGFSNESKIFKEWKEKLDKKSREYLSQMKNWGGEGTATTEATQEAYEELLKNLGKDNFLITLTDGHPNNSESLKQELDKIIKEKKVKLVGVGLGSGTEFVKDYYKAAFSLTKMKITDQERRQGQKDFAEAFSDLLEDMIRHPGKY
ncbi:hypothetical protein KJ885_03040 [Patescibacteria group bacterium]|nr:hypothetical protein [Patescibacteria group bacterium]